MKNLLYFVLFATLIALPSCTKETMEETDEILSRQIAFAENKVPVAYYDLPSPTLTYIDEEFFETYIESVFSVAGKGFEVILGTEEVLYANMHGRVLEPQNGPFSTGPCGKSKGIRPDQLPISVSSYIAKIFPGAKILRAKMLEGSTGGLIYIRIDKARIIFLFKLDGTFIESSVLLYHCRSLGMPMELWKISGSIKDQVAKNFPGAEIKTIFQKVNGIIIVGVLTPDGRRIIGFTSDGTLLWVRP